LNILIYLGEGFRNPQKPFQITTSFNKNTSFFGIESYDFDNYTGLGNGCIGKNKVTFFDYLLFLN
jgi:hypothetical protein